jgi:hypothetical protein
LQNGIQREDLVEFHQYISRNVLLEARLLEFHTVGAGSNFQEDIVAVAVAPRVAGYSGGFGDQRDFRTFHHMGCLIRNPTQDPAAGTLSQGSRQQHDDNPQHRSPEGQRAQ